MDSHIPFKSRDALIIILVVLLLFGGLCWNAFCFLDEKLKLNKIETEAFYEVMGRPRAFYAGFDNGRFTSGVFQSQLEKASSDYFPLFAIFTYKKAARTIDRLSLGALPDATVPLLPVGGDVLLDHHNQLLARRPVTVSRRILNKLSIQADKYNHLIRNNPSIKLIVVPVLSKPDWMVLSNRLNLQKNLFRSDLYVKSFKPLLDPRIDLFWPGQNKPPEEAMALYFKTDHHLNIHGIYDAYRQLVDRIFTGSGHSPHYLIPAHWFPLPNVKFRGSESRRAGKFDKIYDHLEDGAFNLPEYDILINGVASESGYNAINRKNYLEGTFPKGRFVNHYANYFGGDYGLVEFINAEESEKCLLVVGDSFDNALLPLISSHFHRSFFVDLRHYNRQFQKDFSVADFIRDQHVDVLVFFSQQLFALGLSDWDAE